MQTFTPKDPQFTDRVQASFARQLVMNTLGASITRLEPGFVEITLPFREDLTQQHGFLHAGIVTTIVDSACGYAALSLMPPDTGVLSIEYKANFLAPARGSRFVARGRVLRAGRTVTVCSGDVMAIQDEEEVLVATMLATMLTVRDRAEVID
jgi:uncharacterized protein (TIGR00369 family)